LSICYIKAAGYQADYNLIAATHITPTSTKFPVLFVGKMLSVWYAIIHLARLIWTALLLHKIIAIVLIN